VGEERWGGGTAVAVAVAVNVNVNDQVHDYVQVHDQRPHGPRRR
jgi:hypothetical protein